MAKALTLVSAQHPAWTRHDLLKQLALVLPAETRQMSLYVNGAKQGTAPLARGFHATGSFLVSRPVVRPMVLIERA